MFWIALIVIFIAIIIFLLTYFIDPLTVFELKVQNVNNESIKKYSEEYVNSLGIKINTQIKYRFVEYFRDNGFDADDDELITLGTFHLWNNVYYIDILVDLHNSPDLKKVVIHETRHMIVEYLRQQKIINLIKYSEEIAQEKDEYYNALFDSGVKLLKDAQNE